MLSSLTIINYAIIDEITMEFSDSLNIITGETGAGKSIMLGALSLITGKRADSKVLYNDTKKCIVEAVFNLLPKNFNKQLEAEGYDTSEELILRREINPKGNSRAFINDSPTNLKYLESISHQMLDLNRQFELLDIQSADFQLDMIDHLGDSTNEVDEYRNLYKSYKSKLKELNDLKNSESDATKEYDFLKFQYEELSGIGLEVGEQKSLEKDLLILDKAQDIIELSTETNYQLDEAENSIFDSIRSLNARWAAMAEINEQYIEVSKILNQVEVSLDDVVREVQILKDKVDTDPGRKSELESRLNTLYSLFQKHRVQDEEGLLTTFSELESKVHGFESRDSTIKELEDQVAKENIKLLKLAKQISVKREKVFPKLEKKINNILTELAMKAARIEIVNLHTEEVSYNGIDQINILFAANKGMDANPIKKVASGGELSRLMLAMKTTVAGKMKLPTMIFDEIDTGVSGEVAHRMGQMMQKLGAKHQVIVITHSPQVASKANTHFHIYKEETKNRTFTRLKILNEKDRIEELAKMLSGDPPSKSAISNAKELLGVE